MFSKGNSGGSKIKTGETGLELVTNGSHGITLISSGLCVCDYGSYAYWSISLDKLSTNERLLSAYVRPARFHNGYYMDVAMAAIKKVTAASVVDLLHEETASIHGKKQIECIPAKESVILILPTEIIDENVRVFIPFNPEIVYSYVEV